jgi:hypothetical protein
MRRAAKRDANEAEIVAVLELGCVNPYKTGQKCAI